jgi:type I restriction enzyme, S subunit
LILPENWDQVSLKQLLCRSIQNGYSPVCSEKITGKWILGLGALNGHGLDPSQKKPAPAEDAKVSEYLLSSGDFLVSRSNTLDKVGRSALFRGEIENCAYPDLMMRFRVDPEKVSWDYLVEYLRSEYALEYFKRSAAGTSSSMKKITKSTLEKLLIVLPPIAQQKKIAEILGTWDEAIGAIEKLIAAKQKLKVSLTHKLLSRYAVKPGIFPLGNLIGLKHGYAFSSEFFSDKETEKILLTPGNFHVDGTLYFGKNTKYYLGETSSEFHLQNGDLLIVMTDLTKDMNILGNSVILESSKTILHNQRIGKILVKDPERLSNRFLRYLLNSDTCRDHIKKTATGTTVRHTSSDAILKMRVSIPPIEVQIKITKLCDAFEHEIKLMHRHLFVLKQQKRGLMQKLLTGQWRVKTEE